MPIFEYLCRSCRKKTTALVLIRARESEVRCKHCGGADLEKLWSRFASPKSEEARLDALSDPSAFAGLDENDPKSVARWMKKMGREMGEEAGEDFDEDVDKAMDEAARGEDGQGPGPAGDEGAF